MLTLLHQSQISQAHHAKPNLIQRPGVRVVVVLVAGAPATMPAEMMWKLSGTCVSAMQAKTEAS